MQFAELSNFHTHLTLRNLRPEGTRKRAIPQGYGFSLVSFPNYFFEIIGWTVIAVMTGSYAGQFFRPCSHDAELIWFSSVLSLGVPRGCRVHSDPLGDSETREVQEGIWQGISQVKKDHLPIHLLKLDSSCSANLRIFIFASDVIE